MSLINKLYGRKSKKLTENELSILRYISKKPNIIPELSIDELARRTLTSKSSVHRLAKKLNFSGYSELKYYLSDEIKEDANLYESNVLEENLKFTKKLFYENSEYVMKEIMNADQIFCYGTGVGQRNVLEDLKRGLYVSDRFIINITAPKELELAADNMKQNNLLIITSLSGDVRTIEKTVSRIRSNGTKILGITQLGESLLKDISDYIFFFQTHIVNGAGKELVSFLPMYLIIELMIQEIFKLYVDKNREEEYE